MHFTDVADDTPLFLYDCLASFRTLWWNFHVSFRDFFARNIYSKRESKTVAIALTFLVSACFHDVSFSDRRWIYFFLANTFGVLLERSLLLSSSGAAATKKDADERRRGVVLSSRCKAALNRSCLWTLVVFSDGTVPNCVSNYARYFVKTCVLSLVLS